MEGRRPRAEGRRRRALAALPHGAGRLLRARSQNFAERDAEFDANAAAKRALLDEAEKIDVSDPDAARAALRSIQERWEAIGKVPRDDIRPLEARMRTVEEKVREAVDRQWRRTDPEADARVAQFRERVAQFEAQAAKARAAGDARRAQQAQAPGRPVARVAGDGGAGRPAPLSLAVHAIVIVGSSTSATDRVRIRRRSGDHGLGIRPNAPRRTVAGP